jgi:hypothetical protein
MDGNRVRILQIAASHAENAKFSEHSSQVRSWDGRYLTNKLEWQAGVCLRRKYDIAFQLADEENLTNRLYLI